MPKSGSHIQEEIKEEEEEKLMDEICKELEEKERKLQHDLIVQQ